MVLIDPQQHHHETEQPQRLVQERRVKRGSQRIADRAQCRLTRHLECPRQIGRTAEQFLIEPVPPPTDGLGQWNRRCSAGRRRRRRDTAPLRQPQPDDDSEQQTARDPEPALPDRHDLARLVAEATPVGDHVVQTRSDEAGQHGPQTDRPGIVSGAQPARFEAPSHQPDRRDHTDRDQQPVGAQLKRPDPDRWSRRRREHPCCIEERDHPHHVGFTPQRRDR